MTTQTATETHSQDLNDFDRTTARWGRITMIIALVISLSGPLYLVLFGGYDIPQATLWTAAGAVVAVFFIIPIVEPITYFPILGQAAMYQAFMIGNISNKLLPAALIAQTNVGAKAGTKRGELAAVMAICGAAMVHLLSLLVFVGLLGTWLVSIIPTDIVEVTRLYVLPAVLGAVLVQCIVSMKQPRVTVIALLVAGFVTFVLVPAVPSLTFVGTAIGVLATVLLAWVLRSRKTTEPARGPSGE